MNGRTIGDLHVGDTDTELLVMATSEAATASVRITTPLGEFYGLGASKRHPSDEHDREVGTMLAVARALDDASGKIHNYVEERIQ